MQWPSKRHPVEDLVEAHYAPLYRYAYRLSGSSVEAEDLTQETFFQAQSKWSQLRDLSSVRSWLFSILRNTYLHRLRANKQENSISLEMAGDIPDRLPDPPLEIDSAELQRVLNELPEVFRSPIILYYFEDFSYRDIAEQMNIPIGTVMSRLARAKQYLRQQLTPSGAEPSDAMWGR